MLDLALIEGFEISLVMVMGLACEKVSGTKKRRNVGKVWVSQNGWEAREGFFFWGTR